MRGMKSLLVLVLVLGALGAYIYFVESKKPQGAEATAGPKLFSVKAEAIDQITVKAANGDRTALDKANGAWQITSPIVAPADDAEVSGIVTNLATVDAMRTVEESPRDLKQFGLADPRVEVSFRTAGSRQLRSLLIGDKTATLGDLYAKLPNEKKVFLIAGSFDATFNRSTFDLRQKTVLAFDRDKVDQVDVQAPGTTVELSRAGSDWTIVKPFQAPADYGSVEGLIGRVQTAQMKGITAESAADLKPYGLDKPEATITFGLGSSRATLLLGGKADATTIYAKDAARPMVFTVEASLLDDVKKPADELRRKDLFAFRAFNATAIQITRGAEVLAFEKAQGQGQGAAETWRETKPAAKNVDAAAFDTFLTKLANQRAQSFVEAGAKTKTGLESPVLVVVVRFDDGKKEEKVTFGRAGADVYAAVAGQPGAAKVDATEFEDAIKSLDAIK
jgi:Domain of unknown function (DUF4340)